jgi:hypothetical protein
VKSRALLTLVCGAAVLLALVTSAARAVPNNRFSATIGPNAVQPLSTGSYAVEIDNLRSSDATGNNAHVAVPDGFVVDGSSISAATTAAGDCSAATWTAALDGATIDAVAPDAAHELCPGGELTIQLTASAPSIEATYTWTTSLLHDATAFALQGSQPAVAVDGTPPPAPVLTATPSDPSNDPSPSLSFSDADSTAGFVCTLDDGEPSACASPLTYSGLGEGTHTFGVKAVDPAGNESGVTSYSWTVDLTAPPAPTITLAPPSVTASTGASFAFSDGDPSAGFRCRLDGAAFSACTSPLAYSGLAEGTHTFRVEAVDSAGNESTVTTYAWTIDLTAPPAPTITSAPPNVTASTSASFAFSDGDPSAGFRCRLDGAAFSACTSPANYDQLAEGTHTFRVKAVDPAGNESGVTTYSWTVDLTNPVVTIDPASEPPDPTNQTGASFAFTSNKAGTTFECRLDGAQFSSCSSPATYSGLADGRHSFAVRATDPLGHVGLPSTYDWTIDTVAPVTTITSGPPAVSNSTAATFEFTSSETPSTFACSLDEGPFGACVSPQLYVGLADGSHLFTVRATDLAGNTAATSYTWQVVTSLPPDTTPPAPVQTLKRTVGYRLLKLTWSLPTDSDFAYVRVLRSRSPKTPAETLVYQGTGTAYADGRFQNGMYYRYEVKAYDTAGNASSIVRIVVPPSALLRSPRDGRVVKAPPLLLWAGVHGATYYNVQLYRGSTKILSAWPSRAKLQLRSRWVYKGRSFRLRKGGYRWWVWPGFGPRSKADYGQLLGTGTFVVR